MTNKDLPDPITVDVKIVRGVFMPCLNCHWNSECVVPMARSMPLYGSFSVTPFCQCDDYIPKRINK